MDVLGRMQNGKTNSRPSLRQALNDAHGDFSPRLAIEDFMFVFSNAVPCMICRLERRAACRRATGSGMDFLLLRSQLADAESSLRV